MKRLLLALCLSVIATPLTASDEVEPPKRSPLLCQISSDATCELGKAPKVTVKLTNNTGKEIVLINSLDGSDCKMRYPHIYFDVVGPDGKSPVRGIGRCGNTNSLREQDFVKVPPRGTFSPYTNGFSWAHQLSAQNFSQPGKYKIKFTYSTEAKDASLFGETPRSGRPLSPAIVKLLERVPKTTVKSNEIVIEVKK